VSTGDSACIFEHGSSKRSRPRQRANQSAGQQSSAQFQEQKRGPCPAGTSCSRRKSYWTMSGQNAGSAHRSAMGSKISTPNTGFQRRNRRIDQTGGSRQQQIQLVATHSDVFKLFSSPLRLTARVLRRTCSRRSIGLINGKNGRSRLGRPLDGNSRYALNSPMWCTTRLGHVPMLRGDRLPRCDPTAEDWEEQLRIPLRQTVCHGTPRALCGETGGVA